MEGKPRVFISYSHDSDAHRDRVLALSERLRKDGIETDLDRYINGTPPEGWPRWMLNRLDEADRCLLICTRTYYRRFRGHDASGKGDGVDWEGAVITQAVYDARSATTRFIPVLFDPADGHHVPEPVRGQSCYCLTSTEAYRKLLDALLHQSGVEPGPVGEPKRRARRRAEPLTFGDSERADPPANPFLGDSRELIGRYEAQRRIFEKMRAGNHCSLVGPAGSGKSALLRLIIPQIGEQLGWTEQEIGWVNFRTIRTRQELMEAIDPRLVGRQAANWRRLMRAKHLRLLVLDDLGGMDPGKRGLDIRQWLRGLHDNFDIKLLPVSNERLDVLFPDDPTRYSPLANIDPIPVQLDPLMPPDCRRLVESRLEGTPLRFDRYADLCSGPRQPGALLALCAMRFEALRGSSSGTRT